MCKSKQKQLRLWHVFSTCYILVTLHFYMYGESHSRNDAVQVLPLVLSFWESFPLIQIPTMWFLCIGRENMRTFQLSFPTSSSNIPIFSINKISKTHHCPMKQKEAEAKSKTRENVVCILKSFNIHVLMQSLFLNLPVRLEVVSTSFFGPAATEYGY